MTRDASEMDQAVSRTLRESLETLQRTAEELNQAVNDLVSACASTRPANALPSMLRAQTSAASLGASLEVLSRFVTSSLRPASPAEPERIWVSSEPAVELQPGPGVSQWAGYERVPEPAPEAPAEPNAGIAPERPWETIPAQVSESAMETVAPLQASEIIGESAPDAFTSSIESSFEGAPTSVGGDTDFAEVSAVVAPLSGDAFPEAAAAGGFDIAALPAEEQELHRRANRVAKVSMQDIKLLRPNDVRIGRENRDLCWRLREDLERAHKEYDRRFQTINGHPVDYFYDWLVEILADGDPQLLGEYPYPSTVLRH